MLFSILITGVVNGITSADENPKELNQVVTDIKIYDKANGVNMTPINGVYNLRTSIYALQIGFDLSAYNGNLKDGDFFNIEIPAPFNMTPNAQVNLSSEGIVVAKGVVNSKGTNAGASLKLTMQNLKEYKEKKGAAEVRDVKGSFFVEFKFDGEVAEQEVTFNNIKDVGSIKLKFKVTGPVPPADNSETLAKENFAKFGGVLDKNRKGVNSPLLGINDPNMYYHFWTVRINAAKKHYNTLVITDVIDENGSPMQFIPEIDHSKFNFKLETGSNFNKSFDLDNKRTLEYGKDFTIEFSNNYKKFVITINNPEDKPYKFSYMTTAPADGTVVGNILTVTADGEQLVNNSVNKNKAPVISRRSIIAEGGNITIDVTYRIVIFKIDDETDKPISGAIFKIVDPDGNEQILPETDSKGRTYSEIIPQSLANKGNFKIIEVKAPKGYVLNSEEMSVPVNKDGTIRTIRNKREKVQFTVNKEWNGGDANNRPEVNLQLFRDGVAYGSKKTLTNGNLVAVWDNLPKYKDDNSEPSVYTVVEDPVEDYVVTYEKISELEYKVVNTFDTGTITITGTKIWEDGLNQDGKRPDSIVLKLLADGQEIEQKTVSKIDNWQYTFGPKPKKNANGEKINYSVSEERVDGYELPLYESKSETEIDVKNIRTPETVNISGRKVWNDGNSSGRPEKIVIKLMNGNEEVDRQETGKNKNWEYNFADKPKYKNGSVIDYRVEEVAVNGYTSSLEGDKDNGFTIVNTLLRDITVVKEWVGNPKDDVVIKLLKDGVEDTTKQIVLNEANSWTNKFTDLPKFDKNGQEIQYSIKEVKIEGYVSKIEGNMNDGFKVKNSPEETNIVVPKDPIEDSPSKPDDNTNNNPDNPNKPQDNNPNSPNNPNNPKPNSPDEQNVVEEIKEKDNGRTAPKIDDKESGLRDKKTKNKLPKTNIGGNSIYLALLGASSVVITLIKRKNCC